MPDPISAALFGVAIYQPSPEHPCAMCVSLLANEIEEALIGSDERIIASEPPDWRAVARTGRIHLCDRCRAALLRAINEQAAPDA